MRPGLPISVKTGQNDADGIMFDCPKCVDTPRRHVVICWSPGVDPQRYPKPGRWSIIGTTFDDLSLVAASSSIQLTTGCMAHFYVRDGAIVDC